MMKSFLWLTAAAFVSYSAIAADKRSYVGGRFSLELDNASSGLVASVEGGGASGTVLEELPSGAKHIGNPKYDDFTIQTDFSMGKPMRDWIKASWDGKAERKDGAIIVGDFNYRARHRAEFYDALIKEVTIPACDASSKETAYLTVKLTPEVSTFKKASGQFEIKPSKQKNWLPANFRLEIKDLECRRVSKIDSFTVKQKLIEVGEGRDLTIEPTKIEYPNLKLRVPLADAETWVKWYEDFLVTGQNGQQQEKSGSLVFLSPNLRDELARITLTNIGLKRFTPFLGGSSEAATHFEVELYVESMRLDFEPPTIGIE